MGGRPGRDIAYQLATADRRRRAAQMRIAGASWDQIAETCGYSSRHNAWLDVQRALEQTVRELTEDLTGLRALHVQRLERLLAAVMPMALGLRPDQGGVPDLKAVEQANRIVMNLVRITTGEAPQRVEVVTIGAVDQLLADLVGELGPDAPAEARAVIEARALTALPGSEDPQGSDDFP
jgi:hypothetical protein